MAYTARVIVTAKTIGEQLGKIASEQNITVAYLHGSYATGKADNDSDIDIAVLAHPDLSAQERAALRLSLMSKMLIALGDSAPELDLTILQDTSILLQYNVIRRGICIYERSRSERIEYELKVERIYEDEYPMLLQESNIILDRILSKSR